MLKIIYSEVGQTARFFKELYVPGFKYMYVEWVCGLAAKSVYKICNVRKQCMKIQIGLMG